MRTDKINVNEIEKKIGYVFKDKSLLVQAFTRSSYCNENTPSATSKYQSNEVLEFFGDGVLSVAIISFLLKECTERYAYGIKTDLGEGDFSNIKSKLSDKQNLSKSMKMLGLQKHLRMGEGDAKLGIENEPSVMEDLFESIVGAIYIDSDMSIEAVIKAVSNMLDMSVYADRQKPIQSAKNALQEWCADKKRRLPAPRYETLSEDGPDHKKTYMRGCYIGDRLVGRGVGKNFKIADAEAAEDALKSLLAENNVEKTTTVVKNPSNSGATTANRNSKNSSDSKDTAEIFAAAKTKKITEDQKTISYVETLKKYASTNKKPPAAFKDLGQIKRSGDVVYRVECVFADQSVTGEGKTRSEARSNASKLMVDKIIPENPTQTAAVKKKKTSVQNNGSTATERNAPHQKTGAAKKGSQNRNGKNKKAQIRPAKTTN